MIIHRSLFLLTALAALVCQASAQFLGGPPPQPPKQGKAGAPVDLTGYWVSVVTEDWRWRMVTPLKGDAASIPINAADPAKDQASGEKCKAYGAPAIMRLPGRLHITWQDDNTLRIDADYGQQTRPFHFEAGSPQGAPLWQGYSTERWEGPLSFDPSSGIPLGLSPRLGQRSRSLEVVTTNLRPGYLRKNGVPYSDRTTLREYYDLFDEPNGETWFIVTTIVEDPVYLGRPFVTTSNFKKQATDAGWSPKPCTVK